MALAPLVSRVRRSAHPWFAAPAPLPNGAPYMGDVNGGPIGLTVELFLGQLGWVDVSQYARYSDRIRISRGLPDQTTQLTPQTCSLALNNRDGRFSPRNAIGPWYGLIQRNTPLRVSRWQNGIQRFRFVGEVPEWPGTWDISQTDIYVPIQVSGSLRRLNQSSAAIGSAMYRWYTLQTTATALLAYWPCEDGQYSTTLASGLAAGPALSITGLPAYSSDGSFPCSDSVPVLNGSTWTAAIPAYAGIPQVNGLNLLLDIPTSGDVNNAVVASMFTGGTVARTDVVYTTAGNGTLTMNCYSAPGALLMSTSTSAINPNGSNGQLALLQIGLAATAVPSAGVIGSLALWASDATTLVQAVNGSSGAFTSGATLGQITSIAINPGGAGGLTGCSVGHVAAYAVQPVSSYYLTGSTFYAPPFTAWNGENPYDRFLRLCLEEGVSGVVQTAAQLESLNPTGMGYQSDGTFVALIQQCFDTDLGMPYETADQLGLGARTRLSLYNQNTAYSDSRPVLTIDYAQHQLSAPPVPADDDLLVTNDVTVSRVNGSSARYVLNSGPLSTQPPPNGVGDYQTAPPISLSRDGLLADQAAWRVHLGTVNEPRYPSVSLNLRRASAYGQVALLSAALTVDVGDMVQILNPPPSLLGPDTVTALITGYTEVLGTWEHDITFVTRPQSPYVVAILEDPVLGHADTDGSTLAQAYPLGTETTLLISTTGATGGSPLWTTNSADCPFDIAASGERITVTAITGSSSPQTFTVTRSVNGVVKPQIAGTDVRLWQPMILSF